MGLRGRLKISRSTQSPQPSQSPQPDHELQTKRYPFSPSRPSDRARPHHRPHTKSFDTYHNPTTHHPPTLYRHKSARASRSFDIEQQQQHRGRRSHSLWSPTPLLGNVAAQFRSEMNSKDTPRKGGGGLTLEEICRLSSLNGSESTPDSSLSPQKIFSSLISIENL